MCATGFRLVSAHTTGFTTGFLWRFSTNTAGNFPDVSWKSWCNTNKTTHSANMLLMIKKYQTRTLRVNVCASLSGSLSWWSWTAAGWMLRSASRPLTLSATWPWTWAPTPTTTSKSERGAGPDCRPGPNSAHRSTAETVRSLSVLQKHQLDQRHIMRCLSQPDRQKGCSKHPNMSDNLEKTAQKVHNVVCQRYYTCSGSSGSERPRQ